MIKKKEPFDGYYIGRVEMGKTEAKAINLEMLKNKIKNWMDKNKLKYQDILIHGNEVRIWPEGVINHSKVFAAISLGEWTIERKKCKEELREVLEFGVEE